MVIALMSTQFYGALVLWKLGRRALVRASEDPDYSSMADDSKSAGSPSKEVSDSDLYVSTLPVHSTPHSPRIDVVRAFRLNA